METNLFFKFKGEKLSRILSTHDKGEPWFPFFAYGWCKTGFEIIELGDREAAQEIKVELDKNRELKIQWLFRNKDTIYRNTDSKFMWISLEEIWSGQIQGQKKSKQIPRREINRAEIEGENRSQRGTWCEDTKDVLALTLWNWRINSEHGASSLPFPSSYIGGCKNLLVSLAGTSCKTRAGQLWWGNEPRLHRTHGQDTKVLQVLSSGNK